MEVHIHMKDQVINFKMTIRDTINWIKADILERYGNLGHEVNPEWELVGKAHHIAPMAWLHKFYKPLSDDDIQKLEFQMRKRVPNALKDFLRVTNGIKFFNTTFSISGYVYLFKREIGFWQPFSLQDEQTVNRRNNRDNYFFFGGWDYDGSSAYFDVETGKVYRCEERDITPLNEWNSLEDLLLSEYKRLVSQHDEKGKFLDDGSKIPLTSIVG
jgi:hypothetical protein